MRFMIVTVLFLGLGLPAIYFGGIGPFARVLLKVGGQSIWAENNERFATPVNDS